MFGEDRHVVGPGAQRRDGEHVEGEPVEEVEAEPSGGGLGRQVGVGGGDHPDVAADGGAAADPFELAVLDHAQDLLLDRQRRVGDFIEEQAAAVGPLEPSGAAAHGAGERAGLMAEQLGLEQGLGQGGAVELDQRPLPAAGEVVETGGDQFLAGAPLADDQDRPIQGRGAGRLLHQLEKRPGLADQRRQVGSRRNHRC